MDRALRLDRDQATNSEGFVTLVPPLVMSATARVATAQVSECKEALRTEICQETQVEQGSEIGRTLASSPSQRKSPANPSKSVVVKVLYEQNENEKQININAHTRHVGTSQLCTIWAQSKTPWHRVRI